MTAQAQQASHCLYIPSKTSKCSTGDKGGEQTKGRQTRRPPGSQATPGSQSQLLLDTKPQLRKNTAALPIVQTGINPPKSRKHQIVLLAPPAVLRGGLALLEEGGKAKVGELQQRGAEHEVARLNVAMTSTPPPKPVHRSSPNPLRNRLVTSSRKSRIFVVGAWQVTSVQTQWAHQTRARLCMNVPSTSVCLTL